MVRHHDEIMEMVAACHNQGLKSPIPFGELAGRLKAVPLISHCSVAEQKEDRSKNQDPSPLPWRPLGEGVADRGGQVRGNLVIGTSPDPSPARAGRSIPKAVPR
jgi:hypothetical protein